MVKKKENKKKNIKNDKNVDNQTSMFKKYLLLEVSIPIILVILIIVLTVVRLPYQAKEVYTEIDTIYNDVEKTIVDNENPVQQRVCEEIQAPIRIEEDPFSPFVQAVGVSDHQCVSEFKIWNEGNELGKWTYQYNFNVNGVIHETEPLAREIPKLVAGTFKFEHDVCENGDTLTGEIVFVSGPTTEVCTFQTVYPNKTITVSEEQQVSKQKERIIIKYEPLWQKIIGTNTHEKI